MISKIKNIVKKIFAILVCIIILLSSIMICVPKRAIEILGKEQTIERKKIALNIGDTKEIKVSSRNSVPRSKVKYTIYVLTINNNTKLYFENENDASDKKIYLINNTENLSAFVSSITVESKECLTTREEINRIVGECLENYPKKTTCFPTISHNVSSVYGYRKNRGDFHTGLDLAGNYGDDIFAYKDGKVIKVQYSNKSYGNMVLLEHKDGTQTRYAHMSSISVEYGQRVSCGAIIGKLGSTGNSTGNHLHFEIIINGKTVNPYNYIFS